MGVSRCFGLFRGVSGCFRVFQCVSMCFLDQGVSLILVVVQGVPGVFQYVSLKLQSNASTQVVVVSLGWCELADEDLTPENSSKAVNR